MSEEEVKQFIKNELILDVSLNDNYGPGNSVIVGLRFNGEEFPFVSEPIYIPEEDL